MNLKTFTFSFLALALSLSLVTCCKDDSPPREGKTSAVFNPDKEYGTVKDIDGNEYKTITIGTQTWMAENLRVTHYQNGDPIPNVRDAMEWENLTTGACCSYNNTKDVDTIATYGLLYNGQAAKDSRGLAPDGWHIPNDAEWESLVRHLSGGDSTLAVATSGGKLKETGTTHWAFPNRFADNSSGFTAMPNGFRNAYRGLFLSKSFSGFYWTATEYYLTFRYERAISTDFASIIRGGFSGNCGVSVRCIKN